MSALLGLRVGLGTRALLAHQRTEALLIDAQTLLGGHLEGQVDREAVRVVQREGLLARQRRATVALDGDGCDVKDLGALAEGLPEGILLGVGDLLDAREVCLQLGVGRLHPFEADREQRGQCRILVAEQAHRAHRTTQEPS